eukprot:2044693-Amphidinium_carterae.2
MKGKARGQKKGQGKTHNSPVRAIPTHHLINSNTTLNHRHQNIHHLHLNHPKTTAKAMGNIGTKEARK